MCLWIAPAGGSMCTCYPGKPYIICRGIRYLCNGNCLFSDQFISFNSFENDFAMQFTNECTFRQKIRIIEPLLHTSGIERDNKIDHPLKLVLLPVKRELLPLSLTG